MRLSLLLFFTIIGISFAQAQDKHFSQFYASPMTLNPALTGAFDGRFRVSAIYRDQWRGIMDNPFSTFAGALDLKWSMGPASRGKRDAAAVGLLFYSDKVSGIDFSTTQISVSGAFHKSLSSRTNQYLSLGFQAGIAQRGISYENISFEDQFNGTTGYTDPTNERFPENNFAYGDFAVGLNYSYAPKAKTTIFAGFGIHHFLQPSVSFFQSLNLEEDLYPDNKLFIKYSGQLNVQFPLADKVQFMPRAIFAKQGPHMKLDAGANFRFLLSDLQGIAMHIGAYARPVSNEDDSFSVADVVGLIGIEYNRVLFGFSYDLNLDDVSNNYQGQTTFEFSVAYLGEFYDDLILCPKF